MFSVIHRTSVYRHVSMLFYVREQYFQVVTVILKRCTVILYISALPYQFFDF